MDLINMGNINTQLKMMSNNVFNMVLFDKLKTGNPIIDAMLTTLVLYCITYICQKLNCVDWTSTSIYDMGTLLEYYGNRFKILNKIDYTGQTSLCTNVYDNSLNHSHIFSDRFKALWFYIIQNINDNNTINNNNNSHNKTFNN